MGSYAECVAGFIITPRDLEKAPPELLALALRDAEGKPWAPNFSEDEYDMNEIIEDIVQYLGFENVFYTGVGDGRAGFDWTVFPKLPATTEDDHPFRREADGAIKLSRILEHQPKINHLKKRLQGIGLDLEFSIRAAYHE